MRSKQQPRPSYRWSSKQINDEQALDAKADGEQEKSVTQTNDEKLAHITQAGQAAHGTCCATSCSATELQTKSSINLPKMAINSSLLDEQLHGDGIAEALEKPPVKVSTATLTAIRLAPSPGEEHKFSARTTAHTHAPTPAHPLDDDSTQTPAVGADTCRGITGLMDSRDVNVTVVNVDSHNNVDDSTSSSSPSHSGKDKSGASTEVDAKDGVGIAVDDVNNQNENKNPNKSINASNNSNKLVVDNADGVTSNHTSAHVAQDSPEESKLESKVFGGSSTTEPTMKTTTTTASKATTTTGAVNSNHKINNYEIHHSPGHLVRPLSGSYGAPNANPAATPPEQQQPPGAVELWSELASPRCQSRESNVSGNGGDGRCPSNDSHCSGNDSSTPAPTAASPSSPAIGMPLPATLAPAAAAALLPPQSAAVAAYLNAAAAAAQQNHLLLTNPLAAAASLVQQATQQHSPNASRHVQNSPSRKTETDSILDFSTKRHRRDSGQHSDEDDMDMPDKNSSREDAETEDLNSPLDLSVNSNRKRMSSDEESLQSTRKMPRLNSDFKGLSPGTWVPPINPYLAAVAAANLSPKNPVSLDWNGKQKISPNEATKALEKMTEMTRLGAATETEVPMRHLTHSATPSSASGASSSNGRHSAWQSHWLNKGADAVKDVFKCVWCKQSFPTLATLTTHMKETQHCGVNVPPTVASAAASLASSSNGNQSGQSTHHARHLSSHNANNNNNHSAGASASASGKSDLNLLIKETMPLPRKLVRGQDVWLGKGAEQTRQILKCMWCGQSFRSLAEMTSHMQETQHYTNIISQEQIISWKSTDDKSSSGGGSTNGSGSAISPAVASPNSMSASAHTAATNSTVSAVLTCKVCDQAFASLKELSNHMVKNNHYKEHMMRSAGDNLPNVTRRGRQAKEKRKKSLPVRKLLELERAQQDFKANSLDPALKPLRDFAASTKITCEKCGDKIETALFVDHIRQCLGGSIPMSPRHNNNNALKAPYAVERLASPQTPKTNDSNISPLSARPDILCPLPKDGEKSSSTPSVLNAIEQLIEKSFDTRTRHSSSHGGSGSSVNTPLGSSILKRLGIDDAVDYTKPLMDAQTMHFLRSYSNYSARDRSTSESSSISERGSSRLESVTPERNSELSRQTTPRLTPDKVAAVNEGMNLRKEPEGIKIKAEPTELVEANDIEANEAVQKISVKKEFSMTESYENALSKERKSITPGSRAISPSMSERSMTPQSNASQGHEKKQTLGGGSLNALSSMFDNLNSCLNTNPNSTTGETNNNNTGKKQNANPLAALQKLCDTTDPPAANTRSTASTLMQGTPLNANIGAPNGVGGGVGNMVAFSWACNDAVMNADSIIKCSFCDTPFCSKGAYRHHLSKVHFVKDDTDSQSSGVMKSPGQMASPKSLASPKSSNSKSPATLQQAITPPAINPYDESPQSKFLKYTELAKQLSSKNV